MKKEQKNQEKGLQKFKTLNDAQLKSIKGGADDDDAAACVIDNGSGMMKS